MMCSGACSSIRSSALMYLSMFASTFLLVVAVSASRLGFGIFIASILKSLTPLLVASCSIYLGLCMSLAKTLTF